MYAIRNKVDPRIYFHNPLSGGRKSFTQIETFIPGEVPRLFKEQWQAKAALDVWLRGKLVTGYNEAGEFSHTKLIKVPERKREAWEIIEVEVIPSSSIFRTR